MNTKTVISKAHAADLVAISAEYAANGDGRIGVPHSAGVAGSVVIARIQAAETVTLVEYPVASELWIWTAEHGTFAVYLHPVAVAVHTAFSAPAGQAAPYQPGDMVAILEYEPYGQLGAVASATLDPTDGTWYLEVKTPSTQRHSVTGISGVYRAQDLTPATDEILAAHHSSWIAAVEYERRRAVS